MVRSSRDEVALLREQVRVVAGDMCEWPGCDQRGEHMAHVKGKGMGGSAAANTLPNVSWLCTYHHDILDRRQVHGTKESMRTLLAEYLRLKRAPFSR